MRHGAIVKVILCKYEGCTNHAKQGGVCFKHGAKVKRKQCSSEGCTNKVVRGGVCRRHGAKVNSNDESTAFGSEFGQSTAAHSNAHASEASITGRVGESVPGEVSILCQEIYEV